MLGQAESLDSDEVRNDDGDEVVDPPDRWIRAEEDESLDERLAAEIPDEPGAGQAPDAVDTVDDGAVVMVGDDELDRIDPSTHGREAGQIDGTPEDGDSFYNLEP
ncbi:hypothetical protein [Mycobacterium sherrisii]|uniref:DUF5709 domain-containing protein n=1 Tax=Mycobacterium sherrisii TaxID=243061 RepID=A0A1E3SXK6_9MYCO|nr:hypothetical protein [Mycobacterium sherrisii]MCV7029627.1 hypothetical protein [Mycobacterium sherrisii]MEC4763895.1 hypothetical protein [Mycobacterium sherrisii]ODR06877.1 hypothetical protein BHQ21_10610 [Mycobacterium sherrisii]ORW83634.1 hypothetical protein AWC25_25485 [Mycobacterium sherrisii]